MYWRCTKLILWLGASCVLLTGMLLEAVNITSHYNVTWLAGSGLPGCSDGIGTNASFNGLQDLAVDGGGNVYVADVGNDTIRKVSPDGEVSTLAGMAGVAGSSDGVGTNARFFSPSGIAVDLVGNVFVADTDNNSIRKITSNRMVTTIAGSAFQEGSSDGVGTNASFNSPCALAVDGAGNIYVADYRNCTIRKITPSGMVTTLAGRAGIVGNQDGKGTNALFDKPTSLVVDSDTNVYVTDSGTYSLRKITPTGAVTTVTGIDGSNGKTVAFNASQIAADGSGNLYYESNQSELCMMTTKRILKTLYSVPTLDVHMNYNFISGIASDQSGNVYLSMYDNSVWKVALSPTKTQTISFPLIPAKVYGCSPFVIRATASSGLPVSFTSSDTNVIHIDSNTARILGAGTATICGTQEGNSFFKPATANKVLFVSKAAQTINFGPIKAQTYGAPIITLPSVSSSGASVVYSSSKTNIAVVSDYALSIKGAGLTTITASAPSCANFNAVRMHQVLVVSNAPQTISFSSPSTKALVKGEIITLVSKSSSGLPVIFKSSNPKIISISGAAATLLERGNAVITATQGGDANWKAATPVSISISVQ